MPPRLTRWLRAPSARSVPARNPRRHLRPVEQLEDRTTPANLRLTDAFLVDGTDAPLANPVYGQNTFVQANWASEAMLGNEPAVPVRYTANFPAGYFTPTSPAVSFPADSGAVAHGTGNGSWFWWRGGWYAGTAPFTMTVSVDPDNRIAESNEADNTVTFTVTPVAPATLPMKFRQPIGATPNRDWAVTNYADIDPRPGSVADYRLGQRAYDGHDAIDAGPVNFAAQDAGVPITAVADGVIDQIDGGNFFDRETSSNGGQQWNAVWVNHGNGWRTLYGHLAAGSITVKVGDAVVAGRVLGLMGSAGISTGTHVHYTAYYRGAQVEAGFSPASYWDTPLPYAGDVPGFYQEVGIASRNPFELSGELQEKAPQYTSVGANADPNQLMYFYLQGYNLKTTDVMYFQWVRPNGTVLFTTNFSPNGNFAYSTWWWSIPQGNFQSSPGTWQIIYYLNGTSPANEQARRSFTVVGGAGAGSLRMTDAAGRAIIDGRTTAVDFGTVGVATPTAPTRTFTVSNVAPANSVLSLSNFQLPVGFSLVSAPASIAGGQSGTITVRMDTVVVGAKFGSIRFDTNDPDIGTFEFVLSGTVSGAVPAGAPVLGAGGNPALGFAAGSPPLPLVPTATLTDPDSPSFTSLTVRLATFGSATDRLAVRNQGTGPGQIGLTGVTALFVTYEGTPIGTVTGGVGTTQLVVTLNANATPAATQALLRNITYQNAGGPPTQRKAVQFALTDHSGLTSNLLIQHVINTPNTAPVIRNGSPDLSFRMNQNNPDFGPSPPLNGFLRALDADGNALTYTVLSQPVQGTTQRGTVTLTDPSTGAFTYTPPPFFRGVVTFTFKANDGTADSNVGTVMIVVNGAPRPTPVVQTYTTPEDTAVAGRVTATDPEGDPFAFTLFAAPQHGDVVLAADGSFTYTPAPGFFGIDAFGFRMTDALGATDVNGVTFLVTPVNDGPTGVADGYAVGEDGVLTVGAPAPVTRLRMISQPGNPPQQPGDRIGAGLTYDFTPANATFEVDTNFDGGVSLDVIPPSPSFWFLDFAAANGVLLAPGVYLDAQRFPFQGPGHPGLDVSGDGRGSNTLTGQFTVFDLVRAPGPDGAILSFAAAFEQHSEGNPFALLGWVSFNSTVGTGTGVLANDTDPEGDVVFAAALVAGPQHGSLVFNRDGSFTYTPEANFSGTDTFTYTANDGRADSAPTTVTITVNPVTDAPVARDDAYTVDEDAVLTVAAPAVLTNDTDADGDALAAQLVAGPAHGTLTLNADGSFEYTPAPNFHGTDTFTYRVVAGGQESAPATVTITVAPAADAPTATAQAVSTAEDEAVSGQVAGSDPDGDALTFSLGTGPTHGSLTLNANGSFAYTPAADFHGTDSFTFTARDGSLTSAPATVAITVRPVNDAPTAKPLPVSTGEDVPLSGQVSGADIDGDAVTFAVGAGPAHGTLTLNAAGSFTYTPAANSHGTDSFTFTASDGSLTSAPATVTITVEPVNDAPTAQGQTVTTDEEAPRTGQVTATDVDGTALTFAVATGPAHGTLVLNADGSFAYTPAANFHGPDSFTFTASDGSLTSAPATVSITVRPVNDAPEAAGQDVATNEDTALTGSVAGDDVDGDDLTFAVVGGPAHGTLVLDADTGAFTYTPAANYHGPDSFTFESNDGTADSTPATVSITVRPVNDAPVANPGNLSVDEDGVVTIDLRTLVGDVETAGDALAFAVGGAANGAVTLDADGFTARFAPAANFNGSASFTYTATDTGDGTSAAILRGSTVSVAVAPVNDAPVADPGAVGTNEDTAIDVDLRALAADVETPDAGLVFTVGSATGGTVVLLADGFTARFAPAANSSGTASFGYTVTDAGDGPSPALTRGSTVAVTVAAVNDVPTANGQSVMTAEDTAVSGQVAGGDVDGDTLSFAVETGPAHGKLTAFDAVTGEFIYTPAADYSGPDSFTFKVTDGTAESTVASVTITVRAVNDAPVAVGFQFGTPEDTPLDEVLRASDADGDVLSFSLVSPPAQGTVQITNAATGAFTYTPPPDFTGTVSFTFKVNDGTADSNVATVFVTVRPVNDAPAAAGQSVTTAEDTPVGGTVTATDIDSATLTFAVVANPTNGALAFDPATGAFTYTPNANFNGADSFTFTANDGAAVSNVATVSITVTAVNDAPVALGQAVSTDEDAAVGGELTATDVDGPALTFAVVANPSNGTLVFNPTTGTFTYTPNANFSGTDSFTFKANDGTADSNAATVTVTVRPVNDAPVAVGQSVTTAEDTPVGGTVTADDIDGAALTYAVVTGPTNGTVTLNPTTGAFTYTPNADFNGTDSFAFKAKDGAADSSMATVSIAVAPVNDAPVAAGQSVTTDEDTAATGQLTAADVDGPALTFATAGGPANGTLTVNPNGTFTYTPNANFSGSDNFTFKASDGTADSNVATVTVTVWPVNDAPVAAGQSVTTAEDTPASGTVTATDIDSPTLTFAVVASPANGTLAFDPATGAFTYTPNANFHGSDGFTFRASDGAANSNVATVTVTVRPVNDAPTATPVAFTVEEDSPLGGALAGIDVDGDTLAFAAVAPPAHGTVTVNPNGSFTYTPAAGYTGPDSFTFKANDGAADSPAATVSITVVASGNAAPVAKDKSVTTKEDRSVTSEVRAADADGDGLTFAVVTGPAHGTLTLNPATGKFTYTPAADYFGPDSFTFRASDGTATSSTATVSITVTPVDDDPVLPPATFTVPENSPAGTAVGTVAGTDPDGDALRYSIVGGNTGDAFSIHPTTGRITVANRDALDYEETPVFTLRVKVKDPDGNSDTATVTIRLTDVAEPLRVGIDIEPNDRRNRINPRSHGKIEVAILSAAGFDARQVDVDSLRFGRTGAEDSLRTHPNGRPRYHYEDVNGDGRLDLVVEFETERTGFRAGDTKGILTGRLKNGLTFTAEDRVSTEPGWGGGC